MRLVRIAARGIEHPVQPQITDTVSKVPRRRRQPFSAQKLPFYRAMCGIDRKRGRGERIAQIDHLGIADLQWEYPPRWTVGSRVTLCCHETALWRLRKIQSPLTVSVRPALGRMRGGQNLVRLRQSFQAIEYSIQRQDVGASQSAIPPPALRLRPPSRRCSVRRPVPPCSPCRQK